MKVVIAGRADERDVQTLRDTYRAAELVVAPAHGPELLAAVADAEVLYIHTVEPDVFRAAKRLQWVQSQGAGVEWIWQVPELAASEVTLTNTRGAHAQTIAEHAFGLLLSLTRCLPELRAAQGEHQWHKPSRPVGLSGGTFGVVGLGNIGRQIAKRAAAFDMRVIAVDANEVSKPEYVAEVRRLDALDALDALDDLLRSADVVAVATPLTPETRQMIGAAQLALMKRTAYLLVVSRGGIVDERALVAALKEGQIAGAGLDVSETEPLPAESPLWAAPNLLYTPHCSGASRQTTEGAWRVFAENLGRYVRGEALENVVDKKRGY